MMRTTGALEQLAIATDDDGVTSSRRRMVRGQGMVRMVREQMATKIMCERGANILTMCLIWNDL